MYVDFSKRHIATLSFIYLPCKSSLVFIVIWQWQSEKTQSYNLQFGNGLFSVVWHGDFALLMF